MKDYKIIYNRLKIYNYFPNNLDKFYFISTKESLTRNNDICHTNVQCVNKFNVIKDLKKYVKMHISAKTGIYVNCNALYQCGFLDLNEYVENYITDKSIRNGEIVYMEGVEIGKYEYDIMVTSHIKYMECYKKIIKENIEGVFKVAKIHKNDVLIICPLMGDDKYDIVHTYVVMYNEMLLMYGKFFAKIIFIFNNKNIYEIFNRELFYVK